MPNPVPIDASPWQPLYGARALAHWVRLGGTPPRRPPLHTLRLWWHALWFEQNWRLQQTRLSGLPDPTDPVFVVGPWRSGTTVLHELLAAATGWVTPRTWQCFSPATCFLTHAPAAQAVTERPMDRGQISTHGPQEDEFALLLLGEPSVYRGFLDPRRLCELGREAWGQPLAQHSLPRWQAFVRGIAGQAPGQRVLLKSPNHSFRLPWLQQRYRGARFIWIARHPGELLESNRRMWRAMTGVYGLWECPGAELESFLQDMLQACCRLIEYCLDALAPEQLLWVQFDDLQADPRGTLGRALDFLGSGGEDCRRALDVALARIPVHPGTPAALPTLPAAQELLRLGRAAQQRFGASHAVASHSVAR